MRGLVDDATRRDKFQKALDNDLKSGKTESFLRAFEHGYGRPPQALDLNFGGVGSGQELEFHVRLASGADLPPEATGVPGSDARVGGTD